MMRITFELQDGTEANNESALFKALEERVVRGFDWGSFSISDVSLKCLSSKTVVCGSPLPQGARKRKRASRERGASADTKEAESSGSSPDGAEQERESEPPPCPPSSSVPLAIKKARRRGRPRKDSSEGAVAGKKNKKNKKKKGQGTEKARAIPKFISTILRDLELEVSKGDPTKEVLEAVCLQGLIGYYKRFLLHWKLDQVSPATLRSRCCLLHREVTSRFGLAGPDRFPSSAALFHKAASLLATRAQEQGQGQGASS